MDNFFLNFDFFKGRGTRSNLSEKHGGGLIMRCTASHGMMMMDNFCGVNNAYCTSLLQPTSVVLACPMCYIFVSLLILKPGPGPYYTNVQYKALNLFLIFLNQFEFDFPLFQIMIMNMRQRKIKIKLV